MGSSHHRHGGYELYCRLSRAMAAAKKSRVVRVVDQKTAVVPLHADTLANPDKLLASLRSLFALAPSPSGRGPG